MIRKNLIKSLSVVMATMLAVMTVACGQATADTQVQTAVEETAEEAELEDKITRNSVVSGSETNAFTRSGCLRTRCHPTPEPWEAPM